MCIRDRSRTPLRRAGRRGGLLRICFIEAGNGSHAKSGMRYSKSGRQEQECQVGAFFAAFVRGGAFCVELGATLLVLLGGGAFCVVPGATLPVSLGGGAFRSVLARAGSGRVVLATRSVGGSDMIPSHASSGMALALMHAIKGGDQEAAGRCWFVASVFHAFTRRSSECRGLKFGAAMAPKVRSAATRGVRQSLTCGSSFGFNFGLSCTLSDSVLYSQRHAVHFFSFHQSHAFFFRLGRSGRRSGGRTRRRQNGSKQKHRLA